MAADALAAAAWALAFGGLGVEQGLQLREAGRWRHFPAPDPARYAALVSVPVLDEYLRGDAARRPRLGMADSRRDGSAGLPAEEFCDADGRADLPRLFAAFDAGATLVVSQFHELHAPLARFCRGLEKVFLHPVQANLYLTPPGAQGFRPHYDTHDVLVLQVAGSKAWRIWEGVPVPDPTRATRWQRGIQPEGTPTELILGPGDALYVPRGVMHAAAAQDGLSLHATIGLLEPGMAEALRLLLEMLEPEDPALRRACPSWRLLDTTALGAAITAAAARLATPAATATLAAGLVERLAREQLMLPGRGLLPPAPPPGARLRLTESMHHFALPGPDGGVVLRWAGAPVAIPAAELPALDALAEGVVPAGLDPVGQALVARLLPLGLVEEDR